MAQKTSVANSLRDAERKRDVKMRVGLTAVLVIFAVIVGFVVISQRNSGGDGAAMPTSVTDSGAIRAAAPNLEMAAGTAEPKRVLTIYEDFQCPVCKNFEAGFGEVIDGLRTSGALAVDYHPISILDRASSTNYSSRAANASLCVADSSVDTWLSFHSAIYAQQPAEGGAGLSDDQITAIGVNAGAPGDVGSCIADGRYGDFVTSSTQNVLDTGVNATPTVLLNGEKLVLSTPDALAAAVTAIP